MLSEEAMEALAEGVQEGSTGLVWHAQLMKDGLVNEKVCTPEGAIKPRRPMPHIYASDFFKQLVQTKDGRWIFVGRLNGWPALTALELRSVTSKVQQSFLSFFLSFCLSFCLSDVVMK